MGEQSPAFPMDTVRQAASRFLFTEAVDAISPAKSAGGRDGGGAHARGNAYTDNGRRVTAIKGDEKQ